MQLGNSRKHIKNMTNLKRQKINRSILYQISKKAFRLFKFRIFKHIKHTQNKFEKIIYNFFEIFFIILKKNLIFLILKFQYAKLQTFKLIFIIYTVFHECSLIARTLFSKPQILSSYESPQILLICPENQTATRNWPV